MPGHSFSYTQRRARKQYSVNTIHEEKTSSKNWVIFNLPNKPKGCNCTSEHLLSALFRSWEEVGGAESKQ